MRSISPASRSFRKTSVAAIVMALSLAMLAASCGDSGDAAVSAPVETTPVTQDVADSTPPVTQDVADSTPDAAPTDTTSGDTETDGGDTTIPEAGPIPNVLPVLETNATDAGPRPLLSWQPVEGAAVYELTVLNSAGDPYWAWAGSATEIHMGGFADSDAVGAFVYEPLTWVVTARGNDGQTLALSDRATLEP